MPSFHVARSIEIKTTPDEAFERVVDFDTWTTWSPWLCAEPDAEVTVTPDSASVGSVYAWRGELVGQGEVEHESLERGQKIADQIRFIKPFKSQSQVGFDFEPAGEGTRVTWYMHGSVPWFMFWMRPQMETFIGMDYDRGLRMLKDWIETGEIQAKSEIRGIEGVGPLAMAGVRKECPVREVGPTMEQAIFEANELFQRHGLCTDAEMISVYHDFDTKNERFEFTSGYVVEDAASVPDELSSWSIPTMKALCVVHTGSYNHIGNSWSAAVQYARYKKLKQSRVGTYEIYRNDPEQTPAAELITEIFLPLK